MELTLRNALIMIGVGATASMYLALASYVINAGVFVGENPGEESA